MKSLSKLMTLPLDRDPAAVYLQAPRFDGSLALQKVSYTYPMPDAIVVPKALDSISLSIRAGERVVILGNIGSGKSTLLKVMVRLYRQSEGRVAIDGLDASQVAPADWRAVVGYVGQDCQLFYGSLRANVMIGRPGASTEYFLRLARMTGLDLIAARHPQGYEMSVGEVGHNLSGGQRQLIALARCLMLELKILLLDEPTSAMDGLSEARFIHQLSKLSRTHTLRHRDPSHVDAQPGRAIDCARRRTYRRRWAKSPGDRRAQWQQRVRGVYHWSIAVNTHYFSFFQVTGSCQRKSSCACWGGRKNASTVERSYALRTEDEGFVRDLQSALIEQKTPASTLVLWLIADTAVAGLIWANYVRVEEVTRGEGRVVPASREQVIQSLEGGIMKELFVKEGQVVEQGQELLKIDPTRVGASYGESLSRVQGLKGAIARVRAEAYDSPLEFPEDIKPSVSIVRDETQAYNARQRILQDSVKALRRSLELTEGEVGLSAPMAQQGWVSEVEIMRLHRQANEFNLQITDRINRFRSEANNELTRLESELAQALEVLKGREDVMNRTSLSRPYYKVYVRTDRAALEAHGRSLPIIPGMIASVDIKAGEKTVLSYLLKPVPKAREAFRER